MSCVTQGVTHDIFSGFLGFLIFRGRLKFPLIYILDILRFRCFHQGKKLPQNSLLNPILLLLKPFCLEEDLRLLGTSWQH